MSEIPHLRMTEEEYLAFEAAASERHQYVNGEVYAMSGGGFAHSVVIANVTASLHQVLKGGPCRTLSSETRIRVSATGAYVYPDVSVSCEPPKTTGPNPKSLNNPSAIVEVLSPSTTSDDRGWKFAHYRRIPSLSTYVIVDPLNPRIEVYTRNPDDSWTMFEAIGREGSIKLPALGVALNLADVFAGTEDLGPDGEPVGTEIS